MAVQGGLPDMPQIDNNGFDKVSITTTFLEKMTLLNLYHICQRSFTFEQPYQLFNADKDP